MVIDLDTDFRRQIEEVLELSRLVDRVCLGGVGFLSVFSFHSGQTSRAGTSDVKKKTG